MGNLKQNNHINKSDFKHINADHEHHHGHDHDHHHEGHKHTDNLDHNKAKKKK